MRWLAILLLAACTTSTRFQVLDVKADRDEIRETLDMVDGLDDEAASVATKRAMRLMADQLRRSDRTIRELERASRICAMHLDDATERIHPSWAPGTARPGAQEEAAAESR